MSKIIYICFRDPSKSNFSVKRKLETIIERITPDNIIPRPSKIVIEGNVVYGIANPSSSIEERGSSVLLGIPFGDHEKWWEPGQQIPDGSFSIFRSNDNETEIITDVAGSRSVWYYHDDEVFIASSSQRAIIMVLGNFELNRQVFPWMLSTGSLGPSLSWDRRIKLLTPDTSIILNHDNWLCNISTNVLRFIPDNISDKEHEERLMFSLTNTFKSLNLDLSKWTLPLSGGYDSRSILSMFHLIGANIKNLTAVTWGLKEAINQPGNDALVAKKLVDYYKIDHKYYHSDSSDEPIEDIFKRYLICGEGRIDHIGGYMDGFTIWKQMFLENIEGIIRGDVSFSSKGADTPQDIRKLQGFPVCADFANLKGYQTLGFVEQELPQGLERQENESLEVFRDRLFIEFRIPIILAALNDLKLPYVEVINPLLSRQLVTQTKHMPDHLRSNKSLFKKIVETIGPDIEFASIGANAHARYFLKSEEAVKLFRSELNSENCKSILPDKFIHYLLQKLAVTEGYSHKKPSFKIFLLKYLPKWFRGKAKSLNTLRTIDINILAFRAFIICKMNRVMEEDAALFKES